MSLSFIAFPIPSFCIFSTAIDLYLSALNFKSEINESYIYSKLSELYLSVGENKKAKEYSIKLLKKYPNDPSFYKLYSEMADFEKDKNHPIKRLRAIPQGIVSIKQAVTLHIFLIFFESSTVEAPLFA